MTGVQTCALRIWWEGGRKKEGVVNRERGEGEVCVLLQVWQLGSPHPNFTLEGHEKGINCVDYFQGGDKPYLISGADDR